MGGKILGTTPVTLKIPVRTARWTSSSSTPASELSKPEQLTLKPGDNGTHKVVIPKGKLVLKLQDGVAVTVDGKRRGHDAARSALPLRGEACRAAHPGRAEGAPDLGIHGDETAMLEFTFPEAE